LLPKYPSESLDRKIMVLLLLQPGDSERTDDSCTTHGNGKTPTMEGILGLIDIILPCGSLVQMGEIPT
jgi:hypothetical protein